jgi:hypothetical protein
MPYTTRTWNFSVNNVVLTSGSTNGFTTGRRILFQIIGILTTTGIWTVVGSSDGSSASMTDGVNRITAETSIVYATTTATGAKSWIILRNSLLGVDMLISGYTNSTSNPRHSVYLSKTGFSGGTATALPTAADAIAMADRSTTGGLDGSTGTSAYQSVIHAMWTADGKSTRVISMVAGLPTTLWMVEEPDNKTSGWTWPLCDISFSSSGILTEVNYNRQSTATVRVQTRINSIVASHWLSAEFAGGNSLIPNDVDASYPVCRMGAVAYTAGARGRHGDIVDMWWGTADATAVMGSTYPADGTRQLAQFGHIVFPWNGTTPVIS